MTAVTDQQAAGSLSRTGPYIVALANQKGGAGKSILALALAAVTADAGGSAFVVDVDPQATTKEVAERAEQLGTELPFDWDADTDPSHLAQLRNVRGVDMVFVDCPGSLEGRDVMLQILDQADFVIIPYVHDVFFVTPTRRTAAACVERGVNHAVLINRVSGSRGAGPLEDAQATIDKLRIPRFKSFVREYVAHSDAHTNGLMITEYKGKNAATASADVRRVHTELMLRRAAAGGA